MKWPISLHCLSGARGLSQLQTLSSRAQKYDEMNSSCRNWNWSWQKLIWGFSESISGFRLLYTGTVPLSIQAFKACTFEKGIMFLSAGITCGSMRFFPQRVSAEVEEGSLPALQQEQGRICPRCFHLVSLCCLPLLGPIQWSIKALPLNKDPPFASTF